MFDKEAAIRQWRARVAGAGTLFEGDLDELESHLRDQLEALEEVELTGERAFRIAEARLGETDALAAEFAKVNPLLAWRVALFWLCLGCFTTLAGTPFNGLALHGVLNAGLALELPQPALDALMWVAVLSPLAYFVLFFAWMRRHLREPLRWAERGWARVTLVAAAAALMLGDVTLGLWLGREEWASWSHSAQAETYAAAIGAMERAAMLLGIALPLGLGAFALLLRGAAMRNRAVDAPMFWLTAGCLLAVVREELRVVIRELAFIGGGVARLGANQMSALMWVVSLACPLLLFASSYLWLRRGTSPQRTVRHWLMLVAVAATTAAGLAGYASAGPAIEAAYGMLHPSVWNEGYVAWIMANIVTACAVPLALGTLVLRLRPAARPHESA